MIFHFCSVIAEKREIDDPYYVLEGYSPSKTSHFSMGFPSFCRFFPEPLPGGVFGGSRCRSLLKNAILEPFRVFGGVQNRPLGAPFPLEKSTFRFPAFAPERPGTDLFRFLRIFIDIYVFF